MLFQFFCIISLVFKSVLVTSGKTTVNPGTFAFPITSTTTVSTTSTAYIYSTTTSQPTLINSSGSTTLSSTTIDEKCQEDGWHCLQGSVIYDCNKTNQKDPTFTIGHDDFPKDMETLTIQNCHSLKISFECDPNINLSYDLKELHIRNILSLAFEVDESSKRMPSVIAIENVTYSATFFSKTPYHYPIRDKWCERKEFNTFILKNVYVTDIGGQGINSQNVSRLIIEDSELLYVNPFGMYIKGPNAFVRIVKTKFRQLLNKAVTLWGANMVLMGYNHFEEIPSKGLIISADQFSFQDNFVEKLEQNALYVNATKVEIISNTINFLETEAFKSIYLQTLNQVNDSSFEFSRNSIDFLKADSLDMEFEHHPYDNIIYNFNSFNCSCKNSNWFYSLYNLRYFGTKIKHNKLQLKAYDKLLSGFNYCYGDASCRLNVPVNAYQQLCQKEKFLDYCRSVRGHNVSSALSDDRNILMDFKRLMNQNNIDNDRLINNNFQQLQELIRIKEILQKFEIRVNENNVMYDYNISRVSVTDIAEWLLIVIFFIFIAFVFCACILRRIERLKKAHTEEIITK